MTRNVLLLCCACLLFSGQAYAVNIEELAGRWTVVASPFEGGKEEIAFTATASSDGTALLCHADQLMVRGANTYAADWRIAVEQDGENIRLGWVLDAVNPASSTEFQEPASGYALFGQDADGGHRYIYLLSENIETTRLEPLTLWSDWQSAGSTTFVLPKTQQIYAVVSTAQPFNGTVGYAEIWASVTLLRGGTDAVDDIRAESSTKSTAIYSLQGVRQNSLKPGINIVNGRKIVVK